MKRIIGVVVVALLSAVFFLVPHAAAQNTNNFRISNYDIQYELARSSEGRSVLKTTETITAVFPQFNQNRGIERAIPTYYDNHPVSLEINEVKNLTNESGQYSSKTSGGMKVLRIGDPDEYVQGEQTYRIVYTQHDVTRFFKDTDRDEWYWDTNGTDWRVPIDTLNIMVSIQDELANERVGTPACYVGQEGSTNTCVIVQNEDGIYTATATGLAQGENLTVAFGFNSGTFAAYQLSWWQIAIGIWVALQIATAVIALAVVVVSTVVYYRRKDRTKETQPIVAEYIPPRDASVLVASNVSSAVIAVFTAQLIDLAVRRFIAIIETREKSTWRLAEYDIVITGDVQALREEEREIIIDMFGHVPAVDERLALKTLTNNMTYHHRTLDNDKKIKALIETTYQLRQASPAASKAFYRWAIALGVLAVVTLSIPLAIVALVVMGMGHVLRPLTDKGLALRRYVLGLDKYIKASEVERLKFLQGPETAQKIGYSVDVENPGQLLKLYERVLPYAILFGREKDWADRLGKFYQQSQGSPDWYSGSVAFNGAMFAVVLSNFSQASMYSGGSSSSSGGSSGGGSSGGGGGGGGGGGW